MRSRRARDVVGDRSLRSAGGYRYRRSNIETPPHKRIESSSAYLDIGNVSHGLIRSVGSRPMDLTLEIYRTRPSCPKAKA